MSRNRKGIFCLEISDWWGDLRTASTVLPVLSILNQTGNESVPFVHRDVATLAEFESYLSRWTLKKYAAYPILYLAMHGTRGTVSFGNRGNTEAEVSLTDLSELLANRCKRRIIDFGSCETVDVHGRELNAFIRKTEALAVCGYRSAVGWMESTAFDMLFFSSCQQNAFRRDGMRAIQRKMTRLAKGFARGLNDQFEFRMVVSS